MSERTHRTSLETIEALFDESLPGKPFESLRIELDPYIKEVTHHRVFEKISSAAELSIFLEQQLFCSWDYLNLLKAFEISVGCTMTPWLPPKEPLATAWVNRKICDEESIELAPGVFSSHFELLKLAAEEIGVDSMTFNQLFRELQNGNPLESSLLLFNIPKSIQDYLLHGSKVSERSPHEIFAVLLFARQNVFQAMANRLLDKLDEFSSVSAHRLRLYLELHCSELDETKQIEALVLQKLCGNSDRAWADAYDAAFAGLKMRKAIFDEAVENLRFRTV